MNKIATADDNPLSRRIGVTLVILAIYFAGTQIALPGIETQALERTASSLLLGVISRLSVFALGITPYLSIAVLIEVAMMAHAPLRTRLATSALAAQVKTWGQAAALVLAAVQAWYLAIAMEAVEGLVPDPGLEFRLTIVVTIVAATALIGALATTITRDGVGHGLWVLFAAALVAEWTRTIVAQALFMEETASVMLALSAAILAAAIGMMAAFARRDPRLVPSGQLLWPAVLTSWLASLLLAALLQTGLIDAGPSMLGPFAASPARPFLFALVFFVLFWLRELSLPPADEPHPPRLLPSLALALLIYAGTALPGYVAVPLSLDMPSAVAVVAIAFAIADRNRDHRSRAPGDAKP